MRPLVLVLLACWGLKKLVAVHFILNKKNSERSRSFLYIALQTTIDILKIDIECSEWTSFDAILASPRCLDNVKQLMVEFHPCALRQAKSPRELLSYWRTLRRIDQLGFKLWKVWNNYVCRFNSPRLKGVQYYGCFNAYYLNIKYIQ